jgi:Protein of unknown function (DUF2817)
MNVIPHFSQSYAEARDKFLAAARMSGATLTQHVHPSARGAAGEKLSIDLASLGSRDAPGLLILISGTHGVEGFCGSGCQVALLHDPAFMAEVERSGIGVLMLHALNPYGFSHLRRVNEDNADLNRNFIDFGGPLPTNRAYAELHAMLLPSSWPPPADSEAKHKAWIAQHGPKAYQAAVSGGQYQYPDGLFYGGSKPAWSNKVLRSLLREHASQRALLGWIDFHTGLGPRGHGEKIYAGSDYAADVARTKAWWGDQVTSFLDGTSTSARLTGINGTAAREECPNAAFAGIALEYGTYPVERILEAFRAEQWAHLHPKAPKAQRVQIKRTFRDMFYIDADDWKQMVYTQAVEGCLRAIEHLGETRAHAMNPTQFQGVQR